MSNNKTIAKNTIVLYFRTILTMVISLYTSRVILEKLGVDDYGIYQAVGGIVGFLSFLNGAISNGSSRFLTYELGTGNKEKLKKTFSTLLTAHIIIALIVVVIAETGGLWFVNKEMVIPADRYSAAIYTYHISIITAVFALVLVPFNALIIAHERMTVFAYISIVEAAAKLGICYLLVVSDADKLMVYATLMLILQICLTLFYKYYCNKNFDESRYKFIMDKGILKPVLSFSGWALFSNASMAFAGQGILVLLNMFFAPAIVSARAISLQVSHAAYQFVSNFRTAANPQIVKFYAVKDYEGSKRLLLQSTKFSYYLMLALAVPIFFLADPLLHIWLGDNVPPYTVPFVKIVIIQCLFQVFDASLYIPLYAKGQIKENALLSPLLEFIAFPIVYLLFKLGFSPIALSWAYLVVFFLLGVVVKPILLVKIVDYNWGELIKMFSSCFLVSVIAIIPSFLIDGLFDSSSVLNFFIEATILVVIVCLVVYSLGLDKEMKDKLNHIILKKINSRTNE